MNKILLLAAAMLAPAVSTPVLAAPANKPVARDWSKTVVTTRAGGFLMGNPAARVKLVEYGSLTCSHCAHFATEEEPKLVAKYVRTGKVAFEFRNFIRDPFDLSAALTARCSGTGGFFPMTNTLFATQEAWFAKLRAVDGARMTALQAKPIPQQVLEIADLAGFTQLAKSRGYPVARIKACVGSQKNIDVLDKMRVAANPLVEGTPTFTINGSKIELTAEGGSVWDQIDAKIAAVL